jgi:hypothetical protein
VGNRWIHLARFVFRDFATGTGTETRKPAYFQIPCSPSAITAYSRVNTSKIHRGRDGPPVSSWADLQTLDPFRIYLLSWVAPRSLSRRTPRIVTSAHGAVTVALTNRARNDHEGVVRRMLKAIRGGMRSARRRFDPVSEPKETDARISFAFRYNGCMLEKQLPRLDHAGPLQAGAPRHQAPASFRLTAVLSTLHLSGHITH